MLIYKLFFGFKVESCPLILSKFLNPLPIPDSSYFSNWAIFILQISFSFLNFMIYSSLNVFIFEVDYFFSFFYSFFLYWILVCLNVLLALYYL